MVQVSILGYAMSLLCVGLAHEVYLLGFLLFCFGVFWNFVRYIVQYARDRSGALVW